MTTKEIGDFGEKAAEDYLVEMDYLILERNYRLKFGEIDIIAAKDGGLVFVEVKTRKSNLFGEPSEYVDRKKQERVKKAAMVYADVENNDMRFDVIEVFYEEKNGELFLLKLIILKMLFNKGDTKMNRTLKTTIPYLTHIAIHCVACVTVKALMKGLSC